MFTPQAGIGVPVMLEPLDDLKLELHAISLRTDRQHSLVDIMIMHTIMQH